MNHKHFVTVVLHEVKNPLASIQSSIELLEILNSTIPEKLKVNNYRHFDIIKKQTLRINNLMNTFLLLEKLEADSFEVNIEQIDIIDKINTFLNEKYNFDSDSKINFNYTGDPYLVFLDWKLFQHSILNLLNHTIIYSKGLKKPEIHASFLSQNLELSIKYYGIGVHSKEKQNLIDPFRPIENIKSATTTGLSLILVKRLVELNNGKIDMLTKEDVGATFTITIPRK